MKTKLILSGLAAMAFAASAHADSIINVTGATAFRKAAVDTIIASYGAGLTGVAQTGTAGSLSALQGATSSIFKGTFPGVSGVTIIRCTFTGSVEGIRDLAVPQNQVFLPVTALVAGGTAYTGPNGSAARYGVPAASESAPAKFAFSDVYATTSPYNVSGLTDTTLGVIVFVPVANKGVSANLTNLTTQAFKALAGSGFQKLSLLTGVAADATNVYLTGRNDLSGTRSTYLAESGYGVSIPVQQWKPTVASGACSTLQLWPVADGSNASSVWNGDIAGNGGNSSGGTIATNLGGTTASVQLKNAAGVNIGAATAVNYLSIIGFSDSNTAVNTNLAKALSWNGVGVTPASALSVGDTSKITNGAYTMWGYEHLLYSGDLSATADQAFFDQITGNIGANIGSAGLDIAVMNVSRSDDGGLVGP